jgi:hypothetical protein
MIWTLSLALQTGCYSYLPMQSAPPPEPNPTVALMISDRGRTLIGERVGNLVEQIEGRVVRRDSSQITMQVFKVVDVRGNHSTWTGEQVVIPNEAIMGYRARKFSKLKTALLVGAGVVALVLTLGRSLDIFGVPVEGAPGGDGPSQS